ncbi:YdhR family protein [Streptomyces sp. ISL-10]|uniref:YdhR family protein n=1 Tax=Streptomyces sp. ISL-10 TaxID=2819172 RepID=UPI001BE52D58|nr:YdhR family protein [Streptomyces sp. ISL-10]MBT2368695.1 YdhR family protein [Streptomyces sp. ISL-10]
MRIVIVWWDLTASRQTIDSLRHFLRDEAIERFASTPGLRLKFWISDRATNRWGAVMLWESADAAAAVAALPNRAAHLIGYPPTQVAAFDVEATVEGCFEVAALAGRGLVWEG